MFQREMELLVVFTIVGSVGLLLALAEGSRWETMEEITGGRGNGHVVITFPCAAG